MAEDVVMHSAIRIDSSSLYVSAYQTFSKKLDSFNSLNSGFTSPPEAFKLISCGSSLPSFPRGFSPGKRIPNTRFIVDGFRHAGAYSVAYFLTHFHSDHYTGLTPHWARGLIFCSGVTARLLVECLKVSETFIVPLEIGEAVQLDGCEVTFVDANHCPGAVQILVRVYTSANDVERYVHTGDMRYDPRMKVEPALCNFIGAETVFLDTTYCNPKFVFPSQAESIDYVARTVHGILTEQHRDNLAFKSDDKPGKCSVLFLIAAYVIGKEKIFMEVSKRCNVKIYVDKGKLEILRCLDLQVESDIFTLDATLSNVHVVGWNVLGETWPYFRPNWGRMEKMMNERGYNRVVGFVPTGWMYEVKRYSFPVRVKGCLEVHLVPYSEHSNYNELRDYMEFLRPKEIVPTVGLEGLGLDSKQAAAMLKCFANLVDETAQKRKFLKGFRRKAFDKANTEHSNDMEGESDEGQLSEKVCGNDKKTYEIVNASSPFEVPSITNTPEVESSIHVAQGEYLNASSVSSEAHCQGFGSISEISNDFVPKGSFAKGTRKRDHNFFFSSSKPEIRPPMASVNDPVPHDGSDLEAPVTDLCSPEVASARAQTQDTPKSITAAHCTDEVLQELKTCLPNWVTVDQLACLLTRSKGDMPQAVSEFYEHETELWKEVNTKRHATPVNSVSVSESSPVDPFNREVSSNARSSLTPSKENTFHSQKSQTSSHNVCSTGPLKKACVKTPRRKSKTQSKLSRWITNSDTYKKPESPLVKKSKQSSITNFFSRTVPRMDDLRHSIREEANIKSMDQTSRNAESDESGVMDLPDLSTKVNHLLQILARCLSESDALMLLHKARGDINMAVELHYSSLERQQSLSDTYVSSRPTASGRLETIKESGASDVSRFSELSIQKATETAESDDKACLVGLPFEKYDPINHACWHAEEPAPYLHLARTFELVEQESGKLKATNMLCNMFRSLVALSPKDVLPAVYLCTNRIAPDYENIDLNIGGSTVLAAIEDAFGVQKSKLKELYNTMGDLGDVAQTCRQTQSLLVSPQALTVHQVYSALCQISKEGGTGSNARRKYIILSLLRCCREKETKFIVRTLVRNLRIGAMMRTVLPALSQAVILNSSISSAQEFFGNNIKIELQKVSAAAMEAYNIVPDLNILVPNIMNEGMNYLSRSLCIVPGIPIKPMLAKITNGIPEVVKRFRGKTFTCEFKYDGQRAQVHKSRDGSVHIFSRNCEDSTSRFPDVVDIVLSSIASNIEDFVLDGEIVAIDRYNENKIRAFQCLSSRARGRNGSLIQTENVKVDVCLFVFDLMLLNGKQLLACPLLERRKYMKELFPVAKPGYLEYAKEMTGLYLRLSRMLLSTLHQNALIPG